MSDWFDAHMLPPLALDAKNKGILYGDTPHPGNILIAAQLTSIAGPADPRYPQFADVINLRVDPVELVKHLREPPAHWWALCGAPRPDNKPVLIHVDAVDFTSLAKGLSRLARAFPAAHFIVDPFTGGKDSRWAAGVCLAEEPNIWITTRGLYSNPSGWEKRSDREAFYFVIGEVGAGKLLFASGMNAEQIQTAVMSPAVWLESISFLDAAQRDLILSENTKTFLSRSRRSENLL